MEALACSIEKEALIDGRYRVDARLGHGTMGVVYRARDLALDRVVAIKLLEPTVGVSSGEARFAREARTLARIRHENVVQVYALGIDDGRQYIAMEHVDGRSLDTVIEATGSERARMPLERAVGIIRRVAAGLGAVHASGLVHRDVKPSNIMIENDTERPVLIDFGLARPLGPASPTASITGGTPCYMAPEQARDAASVCAQSDIYALACTAFEVLTGRCVFETEQLFEMLCAHRLEAPPPISSRRPELRPLDGVFARALAKLPQDRHPCCEAFLNELEEAVFRVRGRASRERTCGLERTLPDLHAVETPSNVNVLVLQRSDGLRRNVVRVVRKTFQSSGDAVDIECIDSEGDFARIVSRRSTDIVILDDDTTAGRTEEVLHAVRRAPRGDHAEVIALARADSPSWPRFGRYDVVGVPKPVSLHVLHVVLTRLGQKIVQRHSLRLREAFSAEPAAPPPDPPRSPP